MNVGKPNKQIIAKEMPKIALVWPQRNEEGDKWLSGSVLKPSELPKEVHHICAPNTKGAKTQLGQILQMCLIEKATPECIAKSLRNNPSEMANKCSL